MDKHFEPVTARSLAEKIVDKAQQFSPWQTRASQKNAIESIIEPHIRKPSDDDKPLFNLEADIEWLVRGCMRIMHNKQDGDGKAYRELIEFVSQKVRPTGPETKSVPERCEEAYNEAVRLLENWEDIDSHGEIKYLKKKTAEFLNKPNPFTEADIVKEDETEPKLYPFDLGLAAQGHKVVTRDGRDAKVVAEGLKGVTPICAVITDHDDSKTACLLTLKGKLVDHKENPEDLFIMKEPETIEISIFKGKKNEVFITESKEVSNREYWTHIKTIKTTI